MTTTTTSSLDEFSLETSDEFESVTITTVVPMNPVFITLFKWLLRLTCLVVIFLATWANGQLIKLFYTRPFYKESSAKWYIIFKAIFDTLYILVSAPIIFSLTFHVDIIHRNIFTCKLLTYIHYFCDDAITIMLMLLCLDRMLRITCAYRLRTRFSLTVCVIVTVFFLFLNIHHLIRLQLEDGFCLKIQQSIFDNNFDIYYSYIYTSITWSIIFLASINLGMSIHFDRLRRVEEKRKMKVTVNRLKPIESDRVELIKNDDDFEENNAVTIDLGPEHQKAQEEQQQQDNVDLQLTVCVLINALIFLACNLPNFVIFVMKFVYHSRFTTMGYVFVYISIFPLLIAHTISYFIFNHLAARLFRSRV